MSPTVSVVIPSYNHAQYIEVAVRSVLGQTLDDIELIVIDDGSMDETISRLANFKDSRLQVICQENCGAHTTINRGLKMARGRYLAVLNSDDEYMPDRLELAVAELERAPELGFVASWIELIDDEGKTLGVKRGWENMNPWPLSQPDFMLKAFDKFTLNLFVSNFVSTTSNIVMRRKLFEEVGGFRNLRFAHDWDFCLRAVESSRALLISKPLMKYRVHDTNTIRQDQTGMIFEICWVLATNLPLFRERLIRDATPEQARDFLNWLCNSLYTFGNDRLFVLLTFLVSSSSQKDNEGLLFDLLDTKNPLRAWCLEKIRENNAQVPQADQPESNMSKLVRWFLGNVEGRL